MVICGSNVQIHAVYHGTACPLSIPQKNTIDFCRQLASEMLPLEVCLKIGYLKNVLIDDWSSVAIAMAQKFPHFVPHNKYGGFDAGKSTCPTFICIT